MGGFYPPQGVAIAPPAAPTLLVADETELSTTSTSYTSLKQFNLIKDSGLGLEWSKLKIIVECYIDTSGQTLTLGVFIAGEATPRAEITFTETSYTVKTAEVDISDLGDGKHLIDMQVKVTGGTGYFRQWEVYGVL